MCSFCSAHFPCKVEYLLLPTKKTAVHGTSLFIHLYYQAFNFCFMYLANACAFFIFSIFFISFAYVINLMLLISLSPVVILL